MGLSPPRHCKCIGLIHLRQLNIERLGEQLWGSTCCYMGEHLLLTIERLPLYKFRCKVTKKQKNKQACVVSRYKFGSSSHVGLLSKGYSFSEYQSNCGLYTTPSADLIARRPSLVVRCLLPHCRWKVNMAYNKNKRCIFWVYHLAFLSKRFSFYESLSHIMGYIPPLPRPRRSSSVRSYAH